MASMNRNKSSNTLSALFVIAAGRGSIGDRQMHSIAESAKLAAEYVYVEKGKPFISEVRRLSKVIANTKNDVTIVKGLGWRAGGAAMLARVQTRGRSRYFVTAGDAVGSYERNNHSWFRGLVGDVYERLLYKNSEGFIGRTGYYVGRAIRMGAPSGVTIEGFASPQLKFTDRAEELRATLNIPSDALVVGVSGSINWSARQRYGYGVELVNAARLLNRSDVYFLIVGDGSGLDRLKSSTSGDSRFRFVGRVPHSEVGDYMQVFDVAVISQTRDETGLLRTTTKFPEYLLAGVPIVMSAIPAAFDYVDHRAPEPPVVVIPNDHPASTAYARSLARVIDEIPRSEWARRGRNGAAALARFDVDYVSARLVPYLSAEGWRTSD